jgi:hypothetical protein
VDGTLIQAWASQKSFRAKDGSDDGDGSNFRGQKRTNKTHESTTDADARLYKKSYGNTVSFERLILRAVPHLSPMVMRLVSIGPKSMTDRKISRVSIGY